MATLREVKKRIKTVVSTKRITSAMEMFLTALVAFFLLGAFSIYGFDGNRKGFVLGGGIGFAPTSGWSGNLAGVNSSQVIDTNEYKTGAGFNFLIGHGWDEKNLIVFEINMSRRISDLLVFQKSNGQIEREPIVLQGYIGAVWYHYFGAPGRTLFTTLGLGQYRFARVYSSVFLQSAGTGLLIGGGYEFARHWQFGGYLSTGFTTEKLGYWNYTDLKVLVSMVAF